MHATKTIVNTYAGIVEIMLGLGTLVSVVGAGGFGWDQAGWVGAIIGGIVGFTIWIVVGAVIFGPFLILEDVRQAVRNIERKK